MMILNANKILSELSEIEEAIALLEDIATSQELEIEFEEILKNSFKLK